MKEIPDNSIDSCITDPPYGLEFMGKDWDKPNRLIDKRQLDYPSCRSVNINEYKAGLSYQQWTTQWATELYRILKPGAYLLAFGGTRTEHRLACGIEDVGFVIRDKIAWMYGSGFPKNLNIGKKWDQIHGNKRKEFYRNIAYPDSDCWGIPNKSGSCNQSRESQVIRPDSIMKEGGKVKSSKGQSKWEGWGTALKPAFEFIVLAQKPLDKNYCHNLEKWGCGAVNIDGGRIDYSGKEPNLRSDKGNWNKSKICGKGIFFNEGAGDRQDPHQQGRWPANLILECTCEKVILGKAGERREIHANITPGTHGIYGKFKGMERPTVDYNDSVAIHTDPNCPCRMLDEESGDILPSYRKGNKASYRDGIVPWNKGRESLLAFSVTFPKPPEVNGKRA